jgi:hypothetical protein
MRMNSTDGKRTQEEINLLIAQYKLMHGKAPSAAMAKKLQGTLRKVAIR